MESKGKTKGHGESNSTSRMEYIIFSNTYNNKQIPTSVNIQLNMYDLHKCKNTFSKVSSRDLELTD